MTAGTLTSPEAATEAVEVTSRYKQCEVRLERDGRAGGLSRLLGGLSTLPVKARPQARDLRSERSLQAGDRGDQPLRKEAMTDQ
jgi:hypothetical protein